jgi:ribonuclease HII
MAPGTRSGASGSRAARALVAGVDEAGRGPLAGPVVAAAVILDPSEPIEGLADSKKLGERERDRLAGEIIARAMCWAVARADHEEIDRLNILQATLVAMARAIAALPVAPALVMVDGNRAPAACCAVQTVVGGDATVPAISAASILAKSTRDREMREADSLFPGYGFARHKGYPTRAHVAAMEQLGLSPIHRRSFAPVRRMVITCKNR